MLNAVYVTNGTAEPIYVKSEVPSPHPARPAWVCIQPGACAVVYTIKH